MKYKIYWWAKTEGPKKFGHDEFTNDEEFSDYEIEAMLETVAEGKSPGGHQEKFPNFDAYYPLAIFCDNYGIRKVERTEQHN